jgi:hypothetical protein
VIIPTFRKGIVYQTCSIGLFEPVSAHCYASHILDIGYGSYVYIREHPAFLGRFAPDRFPAWVEY